MKFEEEDQEVAVSARIPCQFCHRKFVPESYVRHAKVCEKTLCRKRQTFDSAKQRVQGTELAEFLPVVVSKKECLPNTPWKERPKIMHTSINVPFRKINKNATSLITKSSNYERCQYCDRSFGHKAFDRHIEWCKEQSIRINLKSTANNQEAKERLEARTKYRAPSIKSRRGSINDYFKITNYDNGFIMDNKNEERKAKDVKNSKSLFEVESKVKSMVEKTKPKENHKETNFIRQNVLRCSFKNRLPKKNEDISDSSSQNHKMKPEYYGSEDCISATGTKIKSSQPSKVLPSNGLDKQLSNSMYENYNPYLVAEYQMKQLFNDDYSVAANNNLNQTYTLQNCNQPPAPPSKEERRNKFQNKENISQTKFGQTAEVVASKPDKYFRTSPTSAFSRYASGNDEGKPNRAATPMPALEFYKNEDDYILLPPINGTAVKLNETHDANMNRYPLISLSNLSLCSSVSIDAPEESRKPGTCKSADKPRDVVDKSTGQRTMSASNANDKKIGGKKNLKMQQMLYGIEEPEENTTFTQDLEKLNSLLDGENFDLMNSFTEFENVLQNTCCDSARPESQPNVKLERGDSMVSKMSIDSAYNSLNRKSPALSETQHFYCKTSTPETDALKSSTYSLPADFHDHAKDQKLSKFCHECGAKYPLAIAKFCCECGVRRLVI